MKRLLTALCAFLLVSGMAFAEPREPGQALTVRTFTFKHKEADKAAAAIKTLLSAEGSMSIQPSAFVSLDVSMNLSLLRSMHWLRSLAILVTDDWPAGAWLAT